LDFKELTQLVRGSAALFRLLVVDACRAGELTRLKGGKVVAPFEVGGSELNGEGMALLTATSANEDAQESDELRGSFFTHALVSGLLGAADSDGNGSVVLEEAYRYAYDSTLRYTSRTFAGTQHPTFQYDVKGQGSLVLTTPARARANRAELVFAKGLSYLVMSDNERGQVIGEIGALDVARRLSVRPGSYFVRGRASDYLQEGTISVASGQTRQVEPDELARIDYARLVRKSGGYRESTGSVELGFSTRTNIILGQKSCFGALLGYRLDFQTVGFSTRIGYCRSSFENEFLGATVNEYEMSMSVDHTWDFSVVSLFAGGGLGTRLFHQRFDTVGLAPSRFGLAPLGFVLVGVNAPLSRRFYLGLDARVEEHLYRYQPTGLDEVRLKTASALRGTLLLGVHL
jgi:hypothetical protein